MKKIIGGRIYDTDTAKRVAWMEHGHDQSNFSYYSEELYRKRTGEYFLFGEGGPMSKYSQSCGDNSWGWGKEIIPLTYKAATKWAEEHLDGDKYEEIFGPVVEDETRRTVTYSIASASAERLKREAERRGITVGALLDELAAALA